jgi:hypothetical protein
MTDYCASRNQIKNYAPTAAGSTLFAKNIDCVTLEAGLVACDVLTVQGVDLSGINDVIDKTQYQSASGNNTTFAGNTTTSSLVTGQISALNPSTGITLSSSVEQLIATPSNGITLSLTNPSLNASGGTMGLQIGTSKTTSNASWDILYQNYNSAGGTTNKLTFGSHNNFPQTLIMTHGKVGVNNTNPAEALDVSGNMKVSGTSSLTGTISCGSISSVGTITQSGTSAALTQTGASATASLKATTVTSLNCSGTCTVTGSIVSGSNINSGGTLTLTGASAALNQTGASATASLKATTVTSLTTTGNASVTGTLGVTGATNLTSLDVSGVFDPYTFNSVSMASNTGVGSGYFGANTYYVDLPITLSSPTKIELTLYGVGNDFNVGFQFLSAANTVVGTGTLYYKFKTLYHWWSDPDSTTKTKWEASTGGAAYILCPDLNVDEGLYGKLTLSFFQAAHGASAYWAVDGDFAVHGGSEDKSLIKTIGFINYNLNNIYGIRFIGNAGFGNTNAHVQCLSSKRF